MQASCGVEGEVLQVEVVIGCILSESGVKTSQGEDKQKRLQGGWSVDI